MIHVKFEDETQKNAHRLKREKILKSTNRLDKHEHLQGIAIAAFVGLAIAIILFSVFFPALNYMIDNVPTWFATIFTLAGIVGILIIRSAKRSRE